MELDGGPKALDTEMLQGMSLKELEDVIKERTMTRVSRSELFSIIMGWFNEQIKQDAITQDEYLLKAFVKLLQMRNHAEIQPFSLIQVDEVFNEWLEKDAVHSPAYRRRYLITQQDVHRLFAKGGQRPQFLGPALSLEPQNRSRESHSPALSCGGGDSNARAKQKSTNLLQNTDHETHLHTTCHSISSSQPKIDGIDEQSNCFKNTDAIHSQQSNDAHLQDANADDTIITQESREPPLDTKMPQKPTQASCRGRKSKVHNDVSEFTTPPKNYVCRRCHEPGHWIQYCPTNLDPNYDQPPPRDYRCDFCGQHGDHFATLCPKNPYEGSLSKLRKHTIKETRGPQKPSRGCRGSGGSRGSRGSRGRKRGHQAKERSATRSRDRYRSHSPKQRSRSRCRSRSPDRGRPHDIYSPRTQNGDDRHQPRRTYDLDVSPYTSRARLTRELRMSPDSDQKGESSSQSWDDSFRFERRLDTSPSPRRCRSPFVKKTRQHRRDLDKVTNRADEGRLAYDDEIDVLVKPKPSLCSPADHHSQNISVYPMDTEETSKPVLSMVMDAEDLNKAKDKTDEFLRALAAEVMLKDEDIPQSKLGNNCEAETGADSSPTMETRIDDSIYSDTTVETEGPAAQPNPKNRLVHCPPFSPEIVSLFNARENPIVNTRAKRQTASQMMDKSEGFWAHRIQQASQVATVHPFLPHRLLNAGEDCVSVN
ncbi:hypothetical protein O1611_g4278 [Lasiodiplodia mahajangana]|uniref:Uncharacterized protein n=1 Tax=Lasiodiplodia mahajangana TaxID=1108764 RepID=A0ACC2JPS8_9PEZI|nr:hypothetical protein O1611_g4278 [Lasiodiplodia mahajangana]